MFKGPEPVRQKDYEQISSISDEIIRFFIKLKEVVAVSQLHIGRIRTDVDSQHIGIIHKKNISHGVYSIFKACLYFTIFFYRALFYKNTVNKLSGTMYDFLFVSHYTGGYRSSSYQDSYFGEVVKQLRGTGKSCFVVYIDHTSNADFNIFNKGVNEVLISERVCVRELFKIYVRLAKVAFLVNRKNSEQSCNFPYNLLYNLSTYLFSYNTIRNLVLSKKIKEMVAQLHPKVIVTTFEGHALERLIFRNAREASDRINCVGYQHAPVFKYQHSIKRFLGEGYDPDYIFTSGSVPRRQLLSVLKGHDDKIKVLGSSRYIYSNTPWQINKSYHRKCCLVAPEGNLRECSILFSFSLECAFKSNIKFIWRFPPMVTMQSLIKCKAVFSNLPQNISISKSSLLEDINKSRCVLYRGSSVSVNGATLGLKPIYYKRIKELSIDPLHELGTKRDVVENVESFLLSFNTSTDNAELDAISKYAANIYSPIDISVFDEVFPDL